MSEPTCLPELIPERVAAERLGISVDTLQRIRARGEIAWRKIGGRVKYTDADLAEYVERVRVGPCGGSNETSGSGSLEAAASPRRAGVRTGRSHGSTPIDSAVAARLAQRTFARPS